MKALTNEQLEVSQVPGPGSRWIEIEQFAVTFNGVAAFGNRLAELANRHAAAGTVPTDLSELRGCLYFEQRRYRHFQEIPSGRNLEHVLALLAGIRRCLAPAG